MASLREFPVAIRRVGPWRFAVNLWKEISEDNLLTLAAAMAYSWLFAIFPFLIFLISLVPFIPAQYRADAMDRIKWSLEQTLAKQAANTIYDNVHNLINPHQTKTGLLSIGIIFTLWAASGGVAMTMSALDTAFDAPTLRPFYKQRPLAVALTIIVAIMIVLVIVLLPVTSIVLHWLGSKGILVGPVVWSINIARFGLSLFLMFGVLGIVYRYGANVKQPLRFLTPGSVFTVVVWIGLGAAFRFYVDSFGKYEKTYGTVGGVAIMLLFFYVDSLVLLIGAEINSEVDCVMKGLRGPRPPSPIQSEPGELPQQPGSPSRQPRSPSTDIGQ